MLKHFEILENNPQTTLGTIACLHEFRDFNRTQNAKLVSQPSFSSQLLLFSLPLQLSCVTQQAASVYLSPVSSVPQPINGPQELP